MGSVVNIEKNNIPIHAWDIFTTLVGAGGFGMPDTELNSLGNFVIPFARSVQYALHGITPSNYNLPGTDDNAPHIKLPPHIQDVYASWQTSTLHTFSAYREHAKQFTKDINLPILNGESKLTFITHKTNLRQIAYNKVRKASLSRIKNNWLNYNDDNKHGISHAMNKLTSLPLTLVSRINKIFRMTDDVFKIALYRKLRLPSPKYMVQGKRSTTHQLTAYYYSS